MLQANLLSLELTVSRVLAAQVAGLITLWTQLYTFEESAPKVLAWIAFVVFMISVSALGLLVRPRRIVRFWDRALPDEIFRGAARTTPADEAGALEQVSTALRRQRDGLERGLRVSVPLGIAALGLVATAFAIDKAFYGP